MTFSDLWFPMYVWEVMRGLAEDRRTSGSQISLFLSEFAVFRSHMV